MEALADLRRRIALNRRWSGILKGGASGVLSKGATLLVGAVSLPLTVRYLGPLEYGIWVTISTTVIMLSVLDLGIANSLTNYISKAYAQQDDAMARRYFATALWLTLGVSLTLGLAALLTWSRIPFAALFHITGAHLIAQVSVCCALCFTYFLLSLPLNLANKVLSGYQEVHLANYFAIMNSVLGLAAILTVIAMHGSIVHLMAFYCAALLAGTVLLNLWLCLWHRPALLPGPRHIAMPIIQDLFGEGLLFFAIQLAGLVVFNSDNLVITHYLGAADVTPYSVAWRLAAYAAMAQSVLSPSLWPAFAEAWHRADLAWLRRTYRRIMNATILVVGLLSLGIGLFGRELIRVWAGAAAVPSAPLLWCMTAWAIICAIATNQSLLMAATQRVQLQAASSVVAAVFNLALSILWVQRIGATGVIAATVVSYLLFICAPQTWQVGRILDGRYLEAKQTT